MSTPPPLRILADENIPLVAEAFAGLGRVRTLPGRAISPQAALDADILLVRSITAVNEALLAGSPVRFVATATIGTDHVDEDYLAGRSIGFASAPGSNSKSVAEYVTAALLFWAEKRRINLAGATIGVVGVGHVGSKVVAKAKALGMTVLCCDPPLKRAGGAGSHEDYVGLAELPGVCDVLTFHVPLTGIPNRDVVHSTTRLGAPALGPDATMHMIDATVLGRMKDQALLINSSRGPVHDTSALLAAREARDQEDRPPVDLVLDVWEGEPEIYVPLLEQCLIGTPHIAGYSLDGKVAGTTMIYQAACRFLNVPPTWPVPDDLPAPRHPIIDVETAALTDQEIARLVVRHAYDIEWDDAALRSISDQPAEGQGPFFDQLRKNYPVRREFPVVKVRLIGERPQAARMLAELGFVVPPWLP